MSFTYGALLCHRIGCRRLSVLRIEELCFQRLQIDTFLARGLFFKLGDTAARALQLIGIVVQRLLPRCQPALSIILADGFQRHSYSNQVAEPGFLQPLCQFRPCVCDSSLLHRQLILKNPEAALRPIHGLLRRRTHLFMGSDFHLQRIFLLREHVQSLLRLALVEIREFFAQLINGAFLSMDSQIQRLDLTVNDFTILS